MDNGHGNGSGWGILLPLGLPRRRQFMRRLIIVGAGGFGREVLVWAQDCQAQSKKWEIGGFLDDNHNALKVLNYDLPVIGSIKDYQPKEGDCFVMGIGNPTRRKLAIAESLMKRGAEFINLIHPTAGIGNNVTLGKGCVLCPNARITCDAKIGNFVTLNCQAGIGHDAIIGDGCTLSSYSVISGGGQLGKGVYLGVHSGILPKAKVGDFATIGAGSVVFKNVKPGTTVLGVPAKKI